MQSNLDIAFKKACREAEGLEEKISPDVMLKLYAYYKQALKGDNLYCKIDSDTIINSFKLNAWMQVNGMSENQAKQEYINLVNSILTS